MSEQRRSQQVLSWLAAGGAIGAIEVVLAVSFAALVFGGYLEDFLADGIGLYLLAASLTLGILAWRGGNRGVLGSVQDAAAAVLAVIAVETALDAFGSLYRAFLTVIAATLIVTLLTGITFLLLGRYRLGNLVRYVPYPVVGGFLAGTGWLLFRGGIGVAGSITPDFAHLRQLVSAYELVRWVPAVAFGAILLLLARRVKRSLVIPTTIGLGFALFFAGMFVTGSSMDEALEGGWMLGPFLFPSPRLFQFWTVRAIPGADWSAVLGQAAGIATAVFVAVIATLFNVSGIELMLRTDLDSNRELGDAGIVNVAAAPFGGIPAYHALVLTSLARQMRVSARAAGLVAAVVPLVAVFFGGELIQYIPRMIVGGVLVFVGLAFLVEWVLDVRRSLPLGEYLIILAILVTIAARGFLPGIAVGLVAAVVLFALNYSRIRLINEVDFGSTYRSNVDRPPHERRLLESMAGLVQILRVNGFVFFGTSSGLLERIRRRVEAGGLRFLVIDLRRVTGMDSSAVMSFRKVAQLAEANGFELVVTGVPDVVRTQLQRGGFSESDSVVRFEPDLDRGLQRCEDGLLRAAAEAAPVEASREALADLLPRLSSYLERREIPEGTVLIRQGDPAGDVYLLESGRLATEVAATDGQRRRVRSMRSGVVVGEIGMYMGAPRTADVVAETPSVVLRLGQESIQRMERDEPELAVALHRWLATTLADRLSDTMRAFEGMFD
ncbi:MAG: SulP family inorganic anion transporter [Actinomycetota bacterium]|nr:SulP family inorganic anion transporter [Actinomycetota bacterium]